MFEEPSAAVVRPDGDGSRTDRGVGAGQSGQTGFPHDGQSNVRSPNTDFVAIAAGGYNSLGIKGYPRGDLDHDRDRDLRDLAMFANRVIGSDVAFPTGCDAANLDPDVEVADVDLGDLAVFQTLLTGPR